MCHEVTKAKKKQIFFFLHKVIISEKYLSSASKNNLSIKDTKKIQKRVQECVHKNV